MLTKDAVLSCIAAFCITASCSFLNCWGTIVMYITSFFWSYDASVTVNQVDFILITTNVLTVFSFVISNWLVDKVGPRLTNLIGLLIVMLGFVLSALITDVWYFVFVVGIIWGFGGISYMTGTNVALRHFTTNRGKALGICASGLGFGTVFFGLLFTYIVNPTNTQPEIQATERAQTVYYFSPEISRRVPLALLVCALAVFLLGLAGSLLMRIKEQPPVHLTENNEEEMLSHKGDDETIVTTVGQALRQIKFWKLVGALYCGQSICVWVAVSYKSFGSLYIEDDHFLSYAGAAGFIMNGVARLFFPFLLDHFNFLSLNMYSLGLEAVLAFSIYFSVHSKLAYVTVVSAVFFIQGTQFLPFSLLCLTEYGPVLGPKVFSYVASGTLIANGMPGIYYWLVVRNFGYFTSFIIQGLQSLVGVMLTYSLRKSARKSLSEVSSKQSFA
jgi:MFS family permease